MLLSRRYIYKNKTQAFFMHVIFCKCMLSWTCIWSLNYSCMFECRSGTQRALSFICAPLCVFSHPPMRLRFLYIFVGSLWTRFITAAAHSWILQTLNKNVWNNWIKGVGEGLRSDYADYSMLCSDGQWGLKSCLASLRKSFLVNAID